MSLVTDLILVSETSPQALHLYSRQGDYSIFPIDQKNISAGRDCRDSFIFPWLLSPQIKSETPKKQSYFPKVTLSWGWESYTRSLGICSPLSNSI